MCFSNLFFGANLKFYYNFLSVSSTPIYHIFLVWLDLPRWKFQISFCKVCCIRFWNSRLKAMTFAPEIVRYVVLTGPAAYEFWSSCFLVIFSWDSFVLFCEIWWNLVTVCFLEQTKWFYSSSSTVVEKVQKNRIWTFAWGLMYSVVSHDRIAAFTVILEYYIVLRSTE